MSRRNTVRTHSLIAALAAGLLSTAALAQTSTGTPPGAGDGGSPASPAASQNRPATPGAAGTAAPPAPSRGAGSMATQGAAPMGAAGAGSAGMAAGAGAPQDGIVTSVGIVPRSAVPEGWTVQPVGPGVVQIHPPKDPLVERREARSEARAEYRARKSDAKQDYRQEVKAAKQERKAEYREANEEAKRELTAPAR
ncbi:hypothetical protein [Paracidovorax citrulli]